MMIRPLHTPEGIDLSTLSDGADHKVKSELAVRIGEAIRRLKLTQEDAGKRMGVSQSKVSGLLRGDFSHISERKLMQCLARLGYDVEIRVSLSQTPVGHVEVSAADAAATPA